MKLRLRGFRIGFLIGLIILGSVILLWTRSLSVGDSAQIVFSYQSRIVLSSENGALSASAEWSVPRPIHLETGLSSQPVDTWINRTPLGRFEWTALNRGGLGITFPHWLAVVIAATVLGWLWIARKFIFENKQSDT